MIRLAKKLLNIIEKKIDKKIRKNSKTDIPKTPDLKVSLTIR